jgi:hypothetical protein
MNALSNLTNDTAVVIRREVFDICVDAGMAVSEAEQLSTAAGMTGVILKRWRAPMTGVNMALVQLDERPHGQLELPMAALKQEPTEPQHDV